MIKTPTIDEEIIHALLTLTAEQKFYVLKFIETIKRPLGLSGKAFLQATAQIRFDSDSLKEMEEALKDTERIDWDEWDLPAGHERNHRQDE